MGQIRGTNGRGSNMRIEHEGSTFDLAGIEENVVVVVRPIKRVTKSEMKRFATTLSMVQRIFGKENIAIVIANKDRPTHVNYKPKEISF